MKVKKIYADITDASCIPSVLDKEDIGFQAIDIVNWESYPYKPSVNFRLAHTEDAILIHYKVKEKSIRAKYGQDGENVWTDSCVEFFSIPEGKSIYYNIECNCIGTILLAAGTGRENREAAPKEITQQIKRWSSLGREPFEERKEETTWEVALLIPYSAFFKHHILSLDKQVIKANFYKCGDELDTPHFLTWNPIHTATPDYHRPEFFGELTFE